MHREIKIRVANEMYSAHVTEVANPKEALHNGLEYCDWKNHFKTDSTVFIKPDSTFPYYKERVTTGPELLTYLLAIN